VFHNKFGEGKVLAIEGTGDDARAQVDFPRHGVKWLALSVAKLTPDLNTVPAKVGGDQADIIGGARPGCTGCAGAGTS
jgi:hypothetical protein